MIAAKIEPCPFCGGEACIDVFMGREYIRADHDTKCILKPDTWSIAHLPIRTQIKVWNRRYGDGKK